MFGLLRQNAIMRKALLYYASRDTYRRVGVHPKGSPVKYDPAPIVNDHGSRARAALHDASGLAILRLFRRKPVVLGTFKPTVPQRELPQQPPASLGLE
jgi:hypothetical protein